MGRRRRVSALIVWRQEKNWEFQTLRRRFYKYTRVPPGARAFLGGEAPPKIFSGIYYNIREEGKTGSSNHLHGAVFISGVLTRIKKKHVVARRQQFSVAGSGDLGTGSLLSDRTHSSEPLRTIIIRAHGIPYESLRKRVIHLQKERYAVGQKLFLLRPPLIEALIAGLLMKHQWLLLLFFLLYFFSLLRRMGGGCH